MLASLSQSDARPTGDQEVAASIPAGSSNVFSWRLIMKYFTAILFLSLFPAKEFAQVWLTAYRTKPAQEKCG